MACIVVDQICVGYLALYKLYCSGLLFPKTNDNVYMSNSLIANILQPSKAQSTPKALPVDLSFHPISANAPIQGTIFYNSNVRRAEEGFAALDVSGGDLRPLSAPVVPNADVTPKKPALMLPSMFTSSTPKEVANAATTPREMKPVVTKAKTETSSGMQPEPLTRNQLHQAFNYLLKNDPEFVNKLHEAYVKSFSEMIS